MVYRRVGSRHCWTCGPGFALPSCECGGANQFAWYRYMVDPVAPTAQSEDLPSRQADAHQYLVVMRHGLRLDTISPGWRFSTKYEWDSPLASRGMQECWPKASNLPRGISYGLIAISPFTRCVQTAASILPHLQLDSSCQIIFHRGLSEVHRYSCLFVGASSDYSPTFCQQLTMWQWRRKREKKLRTEFRLLAGRPVQDGFLGSWPKMPESWLEASSRFQEVTGDLVTLAAGRNILLISHAKAVSQSVQRLRPQSYVEGVDFLGHSVSRRPHPVSATRQGGALEHHRWKLEDPGPGSGINLIHMEPSIPEPPPPGILIQPGQGSVDCASSTQLLSVLPATLSHARSDASTSEVSMSSHGLESMLEGAESMLPPVDVSSGWIAPPRHSLPDRLSAGEERAPGQHTMTVRRTSASNADKTQRYTRISHAGERKLH